MVISVVPMADPFGRDGEFHQRLQGTVNLLILAEGKYSWLYHREAEAATPPMLILPVKAPDLTSQSKDLENKGAGQKKV